MKYIYINTVSSIIVLVAITIISGCSSDDGGGDLTSMEEQLALLGNGGAAWVSAGGSITKDGYDVSDQFSGFELTVSGFNYTTVNSLLGLWASSGTWLFKDDQNKTLERNDGIVVTIESINTSQLVLSFIDPNGTGGRYSSIPGDYVFTLVSE